jgi:hypothetical protein
MHQTVDKIVDARQEMGDDGKAEAMADVLDNLAGISLYEPSSNEAFTAWRAVAAVAQSQLEQTLEERGGEA